MSAASATNSPATAAGDRRRASADALVRERDHLVAEACAERRRINQHTEAVASLEQRPVAHQATPGSRRRCLVRASRTTRESRWSSELERAFAQRRHAIVAATLIVVGGAPALRRLFDQRRR